MLHAFEYLYDKFCSRDETQDYPNHANHFQVEDTDTSDFEWAEADFEEPITPHHFIMSAEHEHVAKKVRKPKQVDNVGKVSGPVSEQEEKAAKALSKRLNAEAAKRMFEARELESEEIFHVKRSKIPNSGKGLFLKSGAQPLKKGAKLLEYTGKRVDQETAAKSGYGLMLKKGLYIDAKADPGQAKYINAPPEGQKANVRISLNKDRTEAYVVALKKVDPGEELYMGYGSSYWKQHKKNKVDVQ